MGQQIAAPGHLNLTSYPKSASLATWPQPLTVPDIGNENRRESAVNHFVITGARVFDGEDVLGVVDVEVADGRIVRSEEHTSELQSRQYLVCRLLLEKKKK